MSSRLLLRSYDHLVVGASASLYRSIVDAMSRPTDELKNILLEESDFLRGLAFDDLSGPYKCSHQVAQLRPNALTAIQLNQDVTIEEIYPANEADARSAHFGWPVPSALPARPLAILDPRTQAAPHPSTWVTRRLIVQKWTISIRVEDLVALDSFVEVFEAALKKSTTAGKIQALCGVFAAWGDLVPLDVSTVYADGATSGPYGFGRTTEICDSFVLAHGEFVTGYFVWYTVAGIASLQLVKNTNQMSAFYGAQVSAADPSIFNAGGSALLGFSGNCNGQNLLQLQGVWRNDVRVDPYRSISTSTIAFGNATLFNDFQYMINPNTSRISKIRYRSTAGAVAGLQITYSSMQGDNEVHQETPTRGTDAGPTDTWVLEKGELIVRVKGYTSGASVQQLDFLTNKGNTRKFGQESGQSFDLLPPNKDMALYYLLGKSAGQVQSLTLVWGTPPL
ncbi:unnamed protein product [Rhizoctonia solani]|uniref:Jacalin-type lectin domain-containing protein n=1 Tax=Rhizoctonia solani TaxID=456999 RepID=A0A8H3BKU7_9AGAM|nr:unnamed protein product [Rhizoctonia solani]